MSIAPELLETATGPFAYLAEGALDAPVVLCLHGFPDHAPSFGPLMSHLAAAGYRAVAPWMRGYAPSTPRGPYHVDQLADDVVAIAAELSPLQPVRVLGHDWGAVATYQALSKAPERFAAAVTLSVPHPLAFVDNLRRQPAQLRRSWYMFFFQLPALPEQVVPRRDFAFVDRLWRAWSPALRLDPNDMAALKQCLTASMPAPIEYYRAMAQPPRAARARARQAARRRIATPTLHLHGGDDGCISPDACRDQGRWFDGPFRSETICGVGHFMQLEAPAVIAAAAARWFDAHR